MEVFDFGIGWPEQDGENELFTKALQSECKARRLRFICIDKKALGPVTSDIKKGRLRLKFYLDMASETHDPGHEFTKFNYCLKDSGTRVVDDPDNVKAAADKSITHHDLARSKVPTPFTVIIRNWEPTRRLTEQEKQNLGFPFIIKPALGYGQKGVKVIKQRGSLKEIAEARRFNLGDNFLLQEFIEPLQLDGLPAWFRIYNLFGEIIPCWWHPQTHEYQQVTLKEMGLYNLLPLARLTSEIARITRIDWFSCEIAINKKNRKFLVIDYMNDQCAISPKSLHRGGVPDDLIIHMANRIVEKAWQHILGNFTLTYRAIWFPKIKVKDDNA